MFYSPLPSNGFEVPLIEQHSRVLKKVTESFGEFSLKQSLLQQFYCASTRLRITVCEDSSQLWFDPPNLAPRPLMSLYSCGLLVSCENISRSCPTSGDTVSLGQEIPAATDRLKRGYFKHGEARAETLLSSLFYPVVGEISKVFDGYFAVEY